MKLGLRKFLRMTDTSLPVRECGLKRTDLYAPVPCAKSLPVRECGLKPQSAASPDGIKQSLPVREFGLKLSKIDTIIAKARHSPCGSVD